MSSHVEDVDRDVLRLFARVSEAMARATWALLSADAALGQSVVEDDQEIDAHVGQVEAGLWRELDAVAGSSGAVRRLVRLLFVLSELERSADLAEHIAQRAVFGLGGEMTPVSRGIVQRMSEVAIDMWRGAAEVYARAGGASEGGASEGGASEGGASAGDGRLAFDLDETDEELDILRDRLTAEVAAGSMEPSVAAQVTLLARFYERLGDHAVNLSRRLVPPGS